jgi:thioredoxin 1
MFKTSLLVTLSFFLTVSFLSCKDSYSQSGGTIQANEFSEKIKKDSSAVIIDVRTPHEYENGHILSAININWSGADFEKEASGLDKEKNIYIYCLSGGRSSRAASLLRSLGYKNVYELSGGMLKWRAAGLPETTNETATITQTQAFTKQQFEQFIATNPTVLVDFYADWCAPCKEMTPYIEQIETDMKGKLKVLRVDADKNQSLMKELGVEEIPVLQVYKNKSLSWSHTGLATKDELQKQVN